MGEVTAQIEDEIRRWIAAGQLRPGDKLPSERELAEQFGAARTTVRLVLVRLGAEGLIYAEHGRGYFVRGTMPTPPDLKPWSIHGERTIYDNEWVKLMLVDVEPPGVPRFEHHVVRLSRVAIAAVIDAQDRVLMLWRYRFVTGKWGWELPGGIVDAGETGAEAVAREVEEETGWRPGPMKHLVTFQPQVGMVDSPHEIFMARDAEQVGQPEEGEESGIVSWIPLAEIPGLLARGELSGSGTLVALLHVLAFRDGPRSR
jgi:8-oxo-dGTP pyrophosphatase MutT (NUDIX family)/DNA-binding transcriptional regulator YhcF (GntR family)